MNPTLIKNALKEIVLIRGVKAVFNPAYGLIFSFCLSMSVFDVLKIKEICEKWGVPFEVVE
jgi:hypothetical protein